ncbi:MAG: H-NS histone family protein [Staphylococcus equorum]|nr:H-NS histone family protein [Chryseobacterium sp.]MDN5487428.1 H-NS histone family protein [Lactococcus lactis]MDN5637033.1 H-NS histone family protein [Staphylococcus equorum]
MKDIENYTIPELENLRVRAGELIELKKEQSIEDAYNQILEVAESVGFTVQELITYGEQKKKKSARKAVEPRYRNTENQEETWTGRGKHPRWLVAALEKGAKLEDFLI